MGKKLNMGETSSPGHVSPGQAQTRAGLSSKEMTRLKGRKKRTSRERPSLRLLEQGPPTQIFCPHACSVMRPMDFPSLLDGINPDAPALLSEL